MIDEKSNIYCRDRAISHTFGLKLDTASNAKPESKALIEESHKDISQISFMKNLDLLAPPTNANYNNINLHLNLNNKDNQKVSHKKKQQN